MENITPSKHIVFFDGVCNLCNGFVDWALRRDIKHQLFFSALQGQTAKENNIRLPENSKDQSIYFYTADKVLYSKSTAVLKICKVLKFPYNLAPVFLIIPKFLRDFIYEQVAKNRYRFFGKKDTCRLPTQEERAHFLP